MRTLTNSAAHPPALRGQGRGRSLCRGGASLLLAFAAFPLAGLGLDAVWGAQNTSELSPRPTRQKAPADWLKSKVNGIPYEVALRLVHGQEGTRGSRGVIYIYVEPNLFTENNALAIVQDISRQIPLPTTLYITLLTERGLVVERVRKYTGWETSLDTSYTRLTGNTNSCCPPNFTGAQFDRYATRAVFVICTNGRSRQITAEVENRARRGRRRRISDPQY